MQVSSITPADVIARIKQRCEDDFEFFARYFFKVRKGVKFVFNSHHAQICQDLMAVHRGEIENYALFMPPRYSKTELVVILFSLWGFVKNSRCEFLHLSYAQPLVFENSDAIRSLIKSPEFKQLWPELSIRDNKDAKGCWATQENGQFFAAPAGGTVTGFGAGRLDEWDGETYRFSGALIIDDPLKPDDARHPTMRIAVNRRWDETIKSRRNGPRTPTILVMQRIHQEDFAYEVLKDETMTWFVRTFTAIVAPGTPHEHALWPAKHDLATLLKMQKKNPYVFAAQMQQRPSPLGGGILKSAQFGRYKVLPRMKYRKIYVDTAQKTKERNDYSVLEVWGHGVDGNIYLIDMIRDKWEAPELRSKSVNFWNKHKAPDILLYGQLRQMRVEDKASGTGLIQDIKKTGKIPIFAQQRNTDKLTRVMDVVSYIESGYVLIPHEDLGLSWVSDFTAECDDFTADDTHAYDDQIDPMVDAITDMLAGTNAASLWENMG